MDPTCHGGAGGGDAGLARFPPQVRDATRSDLLHLLDMASLTLLFDDPTLIDEQCAWLAHVLAARSVPPDALTHGLRALREARPPGMTPPGSTSSSARPW